MAPKQPQLQPSLLDRLTDKNPERTAESSSERTLLPDELRRSVVRDLTSLLNTQQLGALGGLESFPHVERSTLNYGVPDLSGQVLSSLGVDALANAIRESIVAFEPRIDPRTLKIEGQAALDEMGSKALTFVIDAEVFRQPGSLHLMLKTTVDLDSGNVAIDSRG